MRTIILLLWSSLACAQPLSDVLHAAAEHSERVMSSRSNEAVVSYKKAMATTGWLPTIAAQAIDSKGFAGSTGLLGVGGLMGSPYRSGYGYGLVAVQPIFDFGRTSRERDLADAQFESAKADTEVVRDEVERAAIDAYVQCSLAESERANWSEIADQTSALAKEIKKFVATGQRSIVEDSLARGQVDEASRSQASFEKRLVYLKQALSVMTGWRADDITCDPVDRLPTPNAPVATKAPVVARAEAALRASDAELRTSRSGYLPKIVALGSVGDLEDTRVVGKTDYAVGVALTIPFFDSNRTNVAVDTSKANIDRSVHELKSAQQRLDLANAQLQEAIEASQTELELLKKDLADAETAFSQAKRRYSNSQGSLVDLRESVRNLARVRTQIAENQATLIRAQWSKATLNGANL